MTPRPSGPRRASGRGGLPPPVPPGDSFPGPGRWLAAALTTLVLVSGCRIERVPPRASSDEPEALFDQVSAMLEASAEAWNRGDLEAFLSDYDRAPTTTYIGSSGMRVGWEAIRARYAPLFEPGAERDSLRFQDLRVRPLGPRHALVTARYVLAREGETTASGPFTLLLQRVEGRWKIIHDHSSADPAPPDSVG